MRDPERIVLLLDVLADLWKRSPDLRLGQLLINAANLSGRKVICPELFSLEDYEILKGLEKYRSLLRPACDP